MVDEDGNHTGYFYISYYDKSITEPESFEYDVDAPDTEEFLIYQYNYLSSTEATVLSSEAEIAEANVFGAGAKSLVRDIACETTRPNTTVTYKLYLLDDDAETPTDGELAAEVQETYEYGGYHRVHLDEDDWVSVKEGQYFSVVVTQYCNDDETYYSSVRSSKSYVYSDEEIEEARQAKTEEYEASYYDKFYKEYKEQYEKEGGLTEEEIEAKAEADARAKVATEEVQAEIKEKVDEYILEVEAIWVEGVVNEGESHTYTIDENGEGIWQDWSDIVKSLEEEYAGSYVFDNFPIKAFAEIDTTPDTYTVTFDANGGVLAGSATVSVEDGSAVEKPADPTREGYSFAGWTTDAAGTTAYDFTAAVTGDITLYAQWTKNEDSTKPETSKPSDGDNADKKTDTTASKKNSKSELPQTGDDTTVIVPVLFAGAATCAFGYCLVRRRRHNASENEA